MPGVTLSRWTMSYFAAALLSLVGALALMTGGYGFPAAPLRAPETLVLVHLVALGWLSLLMCGALLQFVPVLVAKPLRSASLTLPALVLLIAGIAALLLGFLRLDGRLSVALPFFPAASVLLGLGFALILWVLAQTLWTARPLPLPARFVVVGLLSLVATVALGIVFALALAGGASDPRLLDLAAQGLAIHVAAGLGGWLTFTAMGVSYRLLAMFMLAPELDGRSTRLAFRLGKWSLIVAIVGGVATILTGDGPDLSLLVAALLGLASLAFYGWDIAYLYRARKRRRIELNSRMAACALVSLALAGLLVAAGLARAELSAYAAPIVYLVAFGWLSGLALAKLYKIVPFLTWLECYGPVLGKAETPRVQDLVVEARALKWFALYFAAVWVGAAALLFDQALVFRVAAAASLVATLGIAAQLVRARRLLDVEGAAALPEGAHRPPLLLSLSRQS